MRIRNYEAWAAWSKITFSLSDHFIEKYPWGHKDMGLLSKDDNKASITWQNARCESVLERLLWWSYRYDVSRLDVEAGQVVVVAVILQSPDLQGCRCIWQQTQQTILCITTNTTAKCALFCLCYVKCWILVIFVRWVWGSGLNGNNEHLKRRSTAVSCWDLNEVINATVVSVWLI